MDESLEKKIREAIADPKNMGELADADRVGTVGNSDCGEMLRLWVKFKEDHGRKVIDQGELSIFRLRDGDCCGEHGHGINPR